MSKNKKGVCVLNDGSRVPYNLKFRERDPYLLVRFRSLSGPPIERSTKESGERKAHDSAQAIIAKDYSSPVASIPWDLAISEMEKSQKAKNLRPDTIEQYKLAINLLRKFFPNSRGPADITVPMAKKFVQTRQISNRTKKPLSAKTKQGNFDNLSIIYQRWFELPNPFERKSRPKVDKSKPRIISAKENEHWIKWLTARWKNWRIPLLFLEVKGFVGCRIGELTSAKPDSLADGRITFPGDATKGRSPRSVLLRKPMYNELMKIKGQSYIFQSFSAELNQRYQASGRKGRAADPYTPSQFKKWMQRQLIAYRKANPSAKYFKLHNYRGTAISKAKEHNISSDVATIIFGIDPKTAKQFYENIDEQKMSDAAMQQIINSG